MNFNDLMFVIACVALGYSLYTLAKPRPLNLSDLEVGWYWARYRGMGRAEVVWVRSDARVPGVLFVTRSGDPVEYGVSDAFTFIRRCHL